MNIEGLSTRQIKKELKRRRKIKIVNEWKTMLTFSMIAAFIGFINYGLWAVVMKLNRYLFDNITNVSSWLTFMIAWIVTFIIMGFVTLYVIYRIVESLEEADETAAE
jgi:uncharacterized membrane protein YuzA (DUF378 family)